jgi:hypothetical protein
MSKIIKISVGQLRSLVREATQAKKTLIKESFEQQLDYQKGYDIVVDLDKHYEIPPDEIEGFEAIDNTGDVGFVRVLSGEDIPVRFDRSIGNGTWVIDDSM